MKDFLFEYHGVQPTTWVYLSSLLMIGLFFKFGRLWSVRNLDLVLLVLLAPGLLFVLLGEQSAPSSAVGLPQVGQVDPSPAGDEPSVVVPGSSIQRSPAQWATWRGYIFVFLACGFILVRLLLDSAMVRRPLLEPNLTLGGLAFIGCSLFIFLMANVIRGHGSAEQVRSHGVERVVPGVAGVAVTDDRPPAIDMPTTFPGYPLLDSLSQRSLSHQWRKVVAICSQLAIVVGLVLIGLYHFGNIVNGIGAATMYLMLPYTAIMTNHPDHSLPAAMLLGAICCYRRPVAAGIMLGLASALIYYPFFMLPLWLSFYWPRGLSRFLVGYTVTVLAMFAILAFSGDPLGEGARQMFGLWSPRMDGLGGIWNPAIGGWDPSFRLPVMATFIMLSCSFAIWPPQKNLGTLISCSAAVMVATQFWHGDRGGMQMGWYLPLLLLTIFRPNLEDRVAVLVVPNKDKGSG
ncbi:MAG: hypothetical protein O2931_07270 [Planctomycetota bacterium]|nr:hypothetical protein [Planctomycetota bacterium]MDA1178581.1 hypothetical protein [Planctomycetota bacterium]